MLRTLALTALLTLGARPAAEAAEPAAPPISLKVELISEEFDLHTNGLPIHAYEEKVREAAKDGEPWPATGMEFALVFRNNSSEPVRMLVGGDDTLLTYELSGKAVVTVDVNVRKSPRIASQVVTIPPYGTYRIVREELSHGARNQGKLTYLTGIGKYKLVASCATAISPAPSGAGASDRLGFGALTIVSAPVEFRTKKPS